MRDRSFVLAENEPQAKEPHYRRDEVSDHQHREFDMLVRIREPVMQREQRTAGYCQSDTEYRQTVGLILHRPFPALHVNPVDYRK